MISDKEKLETMISPGSPGVAYAGPKSGIVKHAASLISNTRPNPERLFVLEGIWALGTALAAHAQLTDFILCPECLFSPEAYRTALLCMESAERTHIVSKKVFSRISEWDDPDGIAAICRFPAADPGSVPSDGALVAVIDGVEIPGNVGTILRSCDAAGVDALFVCNRKARLTHPKLIKGSMGAVFYVPVVVFDTVSECRKWLSDHSFNVYVADTRGKKSYRDFGYAGNTALVVGGERHGVSREWYGEDTELVSIPMAGKCDSLNVAIAATILLYEARAKKNGR